MDAIVAAFGMGLQFLGDFFLAAGRTDDDAVRIQLLLVIGETADTDGVRTEEAVAAGDVSGGDAGDREFQGLAVEHRDDPSNGANEAGGVEASPRHRAWPGDVVDGAGEDGREDLFRGPAELGLLGGEVLALRGLDQKELVDVDTLLLGETQCGACRRADGIVGHGLRGAGDFRLDVRLFHGESLDPGGQTPGRSEGFHRDALGEIFRGKEFLDVGTAIFFGLREHAGRNFLTSDFKEKLDAPFHCAIGSRFHARTSLREAGPPICSRYAAAVRHASVRTRAMRAARSVVEITPRASMRLKRCEHLRQWS